LHHASGCAATKQANKQSSRQVELVIVDVSRCDLMSIMIQERKNVWETMTTC